METWLAGGMWEPHHSGKKGWLHCPNGLWLCPGVQALFVAEVYRGQPLSLGGGSTFIFDLYLLESGSRNPQ